VPKSTVKLPNGTLITVEGAVEDIERVITAATASSISSGGFEQTSKKQNRLPSNAPSRTDSSVDEASVNLVEIVHLAKTCDEADAIAEQVLDKRSAVNRILLPLFLVHEHKSNAYGLTSGQISKVLKELGTPMDVRNVSTILSGPAKGLVTGDKVRTQGQAVSYKIIRRGVQHFKQALSGKVS